jgi:hypothetical protein
MFIRMWSAPASFADALDRGVPLLLVGDLELDEERLAARVGDLLGQRLTTFVAAPGDGDGRTLPGEQPGRGTSHAALAAGDKRDLVL